METTSEVLGFGLTRAKNNNNKESCKRLMVIPTQNQTDYGGGGGFVFGGGPSDGAVGCGGSNSQVASLSDMYDVVGSGSGTGFSFNSSGEMGTSMNVRIPFTAAQWHELERQTTIYKHMISSVPIPPELLIPITKNPSQSNRSVRGSLELGLSSGGGGGTGTNTDPEPWRCRRTDGKKWRCSRDVVPDQKYCERHSHKSRPRSRKPVELHTNPINNNNVQNAAHLLNQRGNFLNQTNQQLPVYPSMVSSADAAAAASFDYRRYFGGFIQEEETLPFASYLNPEWQQQLTHDSTKVSVICQQEPNLNFGGGDHLQAEESSFSPYPNRRQQVQETRHFIDAWSIEPRNIGIIDNNNKYSFKDKLPLTLSIPGGSEYKEIMGSACENAKPQWGSWMDSPAGGPLAEALCLGMGSSGSSVLNMGSPHSSTSSKSSHGDGGRRTQF